MFYDPRMIARACRWTGCETAGFPAWGQVCELLDTLRVDPDVLKAACAALAPKVAALPALLAKTGVPTPSAKQRIVLE